MTTQSICSICGANYEYLNGHWKCPACGAYKAEELSNEEVTLLYSAAQKLRLSNFIEAEEAYSDIVEKYPQNANAYWGRLLSKYGIKYEEDFDGRKIPTCYATSIESVIDDSDYLKAIELADEQSKEYFVKQAEYIERVRKEWVEKAQKEKPYDIFICYKDSDLEKGIERTVDSVVAQDLFIHLTEQGYRVFYSRESLRDKVGEKYEPYIFNALATAKIMLVYGSSAEYIKSTWLKNEWHRFYKKVASGEKHSEALIVACDGFTPSELPTLLSSRQCLDAKRKTFFLDLDKCIKRIIQESPKNDTPFEIKGEELFSGLHEHTYKTKVVKATCIAKGYTIHKCNCGYEYRDSYTPLVDHKFKIINEVAPTCTTDGHEEKVCEICGEKTTNILHALKHQYSKWVEVKHPTCTDDGEEQRKCLRCGITESRMLSKTGHNFGGWTLDEHGTYSSYCQNCGISKKQDTKEECQTPELQEDAITPFERVCVNYFGYIKSYFTSQTSKAQKLKKLVGIIFQIAFLLLMIPATMGMAANAAMLTGALMLISLFPFGIYVITVESKEIATLKKENPLYKRKRRARLGFWISSRILFLMSLIMGISLIGTNDMPYAASFFGMWGLYCLFFAFVPRQSKKISFAKHIKISKLLITLLTIIIGIVLIALSPTS